MELPGEAPLGEKGLDEIQPRAGSRRDRGSSRLRSLACRRFGIAKIRRERQSPLRQHRHPAHVDKEMSADEDRTGYSVDGLSLLRRARFGRWCAHRPGRTERGHSRCAGRHREAGVFAFLAGIFRWCIGVAVRADISAIEAARARIWLSVCLSATRSSWTRCLAMPDWSCSRRLNVYPLWYRRSVGLRPRALLD